MVDSIKRVIDVIAVGKLSTSLLGGDTVNDSDPKSPNVDDIMKKFEKVSEDRVSRKVESLEDGLRGRYMVRRLEEIRRETNGGVDIEEGDSSGL